MNLWELFLQICTCRLSPYRRSIKHIDSVLKIFPKDLLGIPIHVYLTLAHSAGVLPFLRIGKGTIQLYNMSADPISHNSTPALS